MSKIENFVKNILPNCHQKSQNSCAASAMELVEKFEGLRDVDNCTWQNKFGNNNIGYEHLYEIEKLEFKSVHCTYDELVKLISEEGRSDRIIMVSVHNGYLTPFQGIQNPPQRTLASAHIWIGVFYHQKSLLLCPTEKHNQQIQQCLNPYLVYQEANQIFGKYHFDCQTYRRK